MSLEALLRGMAAGGHDEPDTDDSDQTEAARKDMLKGFKYLVGYPGVWKLNRSLQIPHTGKLTPEGDAEFKAAFKRLGDQFIADLEAEAKRIFGNQVLTQAELGAMMDAAMDAAKAAAPTA
jgi:hypothetical protein